MVRNMPFKGSKKLGNEFDPDIVGEDELDFDEDNFKLDLDETNSELDTDYSGADKIEGQGFDRLANQTQIEDFGTQTVGRVSGREGSSYSDFISKASVSKLQSLKGMFQGDKDVLNIIDEEINRRAELKTKIPGSPSGIKGAQIAESAAPKYYTESEIKKGTAFYKEELATIDKYLTEIEDIDPKVRAALAEEAAELETNLEIEKAMFGQPLEEAAAVESVIKAGIKQPEILAGLDKSVDKSGKTVLESMTEDVGKATSENFYDKTFEQTQSGLTSRDAKSYVRNMSEYWGETKGILGDAGPVQIEKTIVKKGDVLPTGGKAKKTSLRNVEMAMPLDDRQIIAGQKLVREKTSAEKKITFLEDLSKKMHLQGLSTPESAAEINRLKKDVKNMESTLKKMRQNLMPIAADMPGETFLGKIDRGKAFPVKESTSKAGSYGMTATYQNELDKAKTGSKIDPYKSVLTQGPTSTGQTIYSRQKDIEFARQNPRAAAATRGAPDPGSPLGVNKPASSVKATDLGDIKQSKSYVKKYEEAYPKILKTLIADAGQVVDNLAKADPALIKKAAASAAIIASNFAKRNPNISAGLMLYSGLVNRNKKEEDYFK